MASSRLYIEECKWKVATTRAIAHTSVVARDPLIQKEAIKVPARQRTGEAGPPSTDKSNTDESSKGNGTKRQRSSLSDSGHNRVYADTASDESEQALSGAKKVSSIYADEVFY